jgi:hypothetical protein
MTAFRSFLMPEITRLRAMRDSAPVPLLLGRAVSKLQGVEALFSAVDNESLQNEVQEAFQIGGEQGLTRKHIRHGSRLYFDAPFPIASQPALAEAVISGVEKFKSRVSLFNLLDAYLDHFDPNKIETGALAGALLPVCHAWPWKADDFWPHAIEQFQLLKPEATTQKIAAHVISKSETTIENALSSAALTTPQRRTGQLAAVSFEKACTQLSSGVGNSVLEEQMRLMEWANMGGQNLAYPSAWPDYASALLNPWDKKKPPAAHYRAVIQSLTAHGQDPRIDRLKRWDQVRQRYPRALQIIKAWLTADSFRMFFDVVDGVMPHFSKRMWDERRAYWTRYLDAEVISEAWVVLGSSIATEADRVANETREQAYRDYGLLSSGEGRSPEHAALIMKIGDLVVADWSHNGSWNIWRENDPKKPQFYKTKANRPKISYTDYSPRELMRAPYYSGAHYAGGSWKYKIDAIILHETGIRVK